jgi:CBS domain-containing protein
MAAIITNSRGKRSAAPVVTRPQAKEPAMNVRDVMTPNPRTVSPNESLQAAAQIMREEDTGVVPVVENGRLVGLVTDRDMVVRAVAHGMPPTERVGQIATKEIEAVTPDISTKEAARIMAEHQVRRLPVVENGRLVGIVSLGDLAVKEGKDSRVGDTLENISEGVKKH